jgi:hypothetical protein
MSKEPSKLHNMVKQRYSKKKTQKNEQFTELSIGEFQRLLGIIFGY